MTKHTKPMPTRTNLQNNALHLWCEQVATTLNDAGITQKTALQGLELDNTSESIKSLFRSVCTAKYGVKSTSQLTAKQMSDAWEELNRHFGFMGIHCPWPSNEYNFLDN